MFEQIPTPATIAPVPRNLRRPRHRSGAVTCALLCAGLMAGCGDKSDTKADDGSSTTIATKDSTATADTTGFCDKMVKVDAAMSLVSGPDGPPDPESVTTATAALDDIATAAPAELTDQVALAIEGAKASLVSQDAETPEGAEEAQAKIYDWVGENCGFNEVDASATEYKYTGLPKQIAAGASLMRLSNKGTELHEMVLLKLKDGVTESAKELLALPEEEGMKKADVVGTVFSFPGSTGNSTVDLEPGRYVVACFIPTGLTPEVASQGGPPPDGAPHFTNGMFQEVTVTK